LLGGMKSYAQTPGTGYANFNSYAPINPAGVPAGFNPYPAVSPFEHAMSSTYNERGIWLNETSNDMQTHGYFRLESIVARFKGPSSDPIGFEGSVVNAFFDGAAALQNNTVSGPNQTDTGQTPLPFGDGKGFYRDADSGLIDASHGVGIQGVWGIERSDGISLELSGLWIGHDWEGSSSGFRIRRYGNKDGLATLPPIYDQDLIPSHISQVINFESGPDGLLSLDVVDLDNITPRNNGIGLNDGSILGTRQRFDSYLEKRMRSELYGAQVNLINTPSRQFGPFTVRPMFGIKYLQPTEEFSVEGHDSGLDYELADSEDVVIPGGIDDIEQIVRDPYRAYIDSSTETHLGGPELGWRYAAGGDHFRLEGETKIGVMGAREKTELWTKGVGQPFLFDQNETLQAGGSAGVVGNFNPFYDPELETKDTNSTTYVTPTFQQSLNTTSKPFAYIPVVRNIGLFREANFKAGWTFLLIGQLQRPNESIVYQSGNGAITPGIDELAYLTPGGDPTLEPEIKKDRSIYFVNYFNFGVEWEY